MKRGVPAQAPPSLRRVCWTWAARRAHGCRWPARVLRGSGDKLDPSRAGQLCQPGLRHRSAGTHPQSAPCQRLGFTCHSAGFLLGIALQAYCLTVHPVVCTVCRALVHRASLVSCRARRHAAVHSASPVAGSNLQAAHLAVHLLHSAQPLVRPVWPAWFDAQSAGNHLAPDASRPGFWWWC